MKSIRLFLFINILIDISGASFAQVKDAQVWENIALSKKLSREWELHFNHEGRISNNVTQFYYAYGDFGITYKFNKWLKASGDYVLLWKNDFISHGTVQQYRTTIRHQWYIDFVAKLKYRLFSLEWRGMYQQEFNNIYSSENGQVPNNYLRNKFVLEYQARKYPWYRFEPYLASEIYYHLDDNDKYGQQFDRIRYFVGIFYFFNKSTSLELYYLYENNFNTNNPNKNFVYGIGFSKDF